LSQKIPRVLMVCLGNICRSPMAEGILQHKAKNLGIKLVVDSAGTSDNHEGEGPHFRAIAEMQLHGIDISHQRSRPFSVNDFDLFDHILVMDKSNRDDVLNLARNENDRQKVALILNYCNPQQNRSVPDPYYDHTYSRVFDLVNKACDEFLLTLN
jgi:protein-tyrosine phosphatase